MIIKDSVTIQPDGEANATVASPTTFSLSHKIFAVADDPSVSVHLSRLTLTGVDITGYGGAIENRGR
jgi:hypothetical protein